MKHTLITLFGVLWAWLFCLSDIGYVIAVLTMLAVMPLAIKVVTEAE